MTTIRSGRKVEEPRDCEIVHNSNCTVPQTDFFSCSDIICNLDIIFRGFKQFKVDNGVSIPAILLMDDTDSS